MEKKLTQLFDLQRFEVNPALQSVIDETHARMSRRISLDDAEIVAAAGGKYIPQEEKKEPK